MSTKKPPLVEAIFELRWGESTPGNFTYTEEDRTIFLPKFSVSAGQEGFTNIESVNAIPGSSGMPFPMLVTYRFRKAPNTWPCMQIGLGIFTVNQVEEGYNSDGFKASIETGLGLFNKTENYKLSKIRDSAKLRLIYQDILEIDDSIGIKEYFKRKFNIAIDLPIIEGNENFSVLDNLALNFSFKTEIPEGTVNVAIAKVFANLQPAYLVETVVESPLKSLKTMDESSVMKWVQDAHLLQKYSYKTLINID